MTIETQPFQDVSPIKDGDFVMLVFGGLIALTIGEGQQ